LNSSGISGGSCLATAWAAEGDFSGKLRVKWFWLFIGSLLVADSQRSAAPALATSTIKIPA